MNLPRRSAPADTVPNLAPMVDVIMVLLVFFLLGTTLDLVKQGILKTELDPRSGPGPGAIAQLNPPIRIALEDIDDGAGAMVYLNEDPIAENGFDELWQTLLRKRRAGADPDNAVVIGAETRVRWKYVIRTMDAAVRAGFTNVQFAVSFAPDSIQLEE
jgi:biopolymer transport protein ExbD